jgi:hypothetical protein
MGCSSSGSDEAAAGLSRSQKAADDRPIKPQKERFMPDFKQLADGEMPADPERHILIEVLHEPAVGKQYKVSGDGLDPDHEPSGDFTHRTLEEARTRAVELAKAGNVPIIYLSSGIAHTNT